MKATFIYALLVPFFASGANAAGDVFVAKMDGIIGPTTANYMVHAIDRAEDAEAACIIFELDTPGGLEESMRTIVKKIMASEVPVVVYVAPSGSRAASAGVFVTIAAHVAAMAPGTNIGAAHPVSIGLTGKVDSVLAGKALNDAAAYIRSIAGERKRNAAWAEEAVRKSVSISETEALKLDVIDLISPSLESLLETIDGRTVTVTRERVTISTRNASIVRLQMRWSERLLAVITNPNIAYILFMLGLLGLYFELSTPGAILPGVTGAISLILAFFAFQTLSVNYAGMLLIILAVVLFILDVKVASNGVLTAGGLVAMIIGSIMLFNDPDPAMHASLQVIIPVIFVTAAFFAVGVVLSIRALRKRPTIGGVALVGQEGDARTPITRNGGRVFVAGTHWTAFSDADIPEGRNIRVVAVKGMTLKVEEVK